MDVHDLSEGWTMCGTGGPVVPGIAGRSFAATVPGTAHTDLMAAGLIGDTFVDRNESDLLSIHRVDWRYTRSFRIEPPHAYERVDTRMAEAQSMLTLPAGTSCTIEVRTDRPDLERQVACYPVLRTAHDLNRSRRIAAVEATPPMPVDDGSR